jgi:hypothetical protein
MQTVIPSPNLVTKECCVRNPLCAKLGESQPAVALRQMEVFLSRRTHPLMEMLREGYPAVVMELLTGIMARNVILES